MNGEGYRDPTADRAIASASKENHIPRQLYEPIKKFKEFLCYFRLELNKAFKMCNV